MRKLLPALIMIITLIAIGGIALYLTSIQKPVETRVAAFKLTSSAFKNNEQIPRKYTCEGQDISPPLKWEGYPAGTKSFALIVEDLDAPGGVFTHWIMYNIPAGVSELKEGVKPVEELSSGAMQGVNDFKKIGYGGPCPPPGKAHRYVFKLYALNSPLDLKPGASKEEVLKAMSRHILAEASLTGVYSRGGLEKTCSECPGPSLPRNP